MTSSNRFALVVSYQGQGYHGWQIQQDVDSIQACVERAVSLVANQSTTIHAAGRTDKGVHALGQVVHFDTLANRTPQAWIAGCNHYLPGDIRVMSAHAVPPNFDARYSATMRHYRYVICNDISLSAHQAQSVWWLRKKLNVEAMTQAANHWIGEHDFSAFRAANCQAKHPIRAMHAINIQLIDKYLIVDFSANAYLYHMIRIMMAVLIKIGHGAHTPCYAKMLLQSKKKPEIMAPPQGLYLWHVEYPNNHIHTDKPSWLLI